MDLLYRVMGLAAAIGDRTSRFSINFIKLNWVLMIAVGVGLFTTSNELRYALTNDRLPRSIGVKDAVTHLDVDKNFVTVHGDLIREAVFTHTTTRRGSSRTDASYYALLDDQHERALLVRTSGTTRPGTATGTVDLTGMLMPIEGSLQKELARTGGDIGGVAFDTAYVLEWGRRPGDPMLWSIAAAVLAVVFLAMLTTWRRRYVVFGKVDRPLSDIAPTEVPADEVVPVRGSGVFRLGQHTRRFTNMGAVLVDAEGTPVLCANVDASSRFMGVKTTDRRGIWTIELPSAGLRSLDVGHQYYGFRRRPALRVHHADGNREATTVMSCDDLAALRTLADRLTSPAPAAG
ncbi:MAG: hypothetical protein K8J09_16250 [Planctomycetes bacterium]|nr:hypothetical protein [Planctomycetota bacterium]MCC7399685.1 hypothetical protein [Planctomycetota bacterium]